MGMRNRVRWGAASQANRNRHAGRNPVIEANSLLGLAAGLCPLLLLGLGLCRLLLLLDLPLLLGLHSRSCPLLPRTTMRGSSSSTTTSILTRPTAPLQP